MNEIPVFVQLSELGSVTWSNYMSTLLDSQFYLTQLFWLLIVSD